MHAHYQLDLLDFFRGKYSWGKLERLLGQLPARRSRLRLAQAQDDEVAEQVIAEGADTAGDGRPALEEWTPEVQYLAATVDRLGEAVAAIIASAGGKPPKVKPLPRPETAFDRARLRLRNRRHLELVAEVEAAQERWRTARPG